MWYVRKLYFVFGESYYVDDFTEENVVSRLLLRNTETNERIHVVNSSLDRKVKVSKDKKVIYADFYNIGNLRKSLTNFGLDYVFGINFDECSIFSTTDFGMELYDIIDKGDKLEIEGDEPDFPVYDLYNGFNVFETDDSFTTLDRIVRDGNCQFTGDKIVVIDKITGLKQEYIVLDRVRFTKLMTLRK